MIGRNPLWVAKQHGDRITTMPSVQIHYSFHPKLSIRALAGGHEPRWRTYGDGSPSTA
jgi:hypothetical protein